MYKETTQINWLLNKCMAITCGNCATVQIHSKLRCLIIPPQERNMIERNSLIASPLMSLCLEMCMWLSICKYRKIMHSIQKNDGSATSLKFIGIERVKPNPRGGDLINQVLRRDAFWSYELNTVQPYGLNKSRLSSLSTSKMGPLGEMSHQVPWHPSHLAIEGQLLSRPFIFYPDIQHILFCQLYISQFLTGEHYVLFCFL